jgi:hypothetical protein
MVCAGVFAWALLLGDYGRGPFAWGLLQPGAGHVDNVDNPQSRGHAIVDNVDDLKSNCPQCPHYFGLNWRRARKGRPFVDNMDNVDNPFLIAAL